MLKNGIRAAVAALGASALAIALGGSAFAMHPLTGDQDNQFQTLATGVLCHPAQHGTAPGGTISALISGSETEPQGSPFQVSAITTYVDVQKNVDGTWSEYEAWKTKSGALGQAHVHGSDFVAPFVWKKSAEPRLKMKVTTNGTYRLVFYTALSNQDGLDLLSGHNMFTDPSGAYRGHLDNYGGHQCTFIGG